MMAGSLAKNQKALNVVINFNRIIFWRECITATPKGNILLCRLIDY
jgi:hypothetical protein